MRVASVIVGDKTTTGDAVSVDELATSAATTPSAELVERTATGVAETTAGVSNGAVIWGTEAVTVAKVLGPISTADEDGGTSTIDLDSLILDVGGGDTGDTDKVVRVDDESKVDDGVGTRLLSVVDVPVGVCVGVPEPPSTPPPPSGSPSSSEGPVISGSSFSPPTSSSPPPSSFPGADSAGSSSPSSLSSGPAWRGFQSLNSGNRMAPQRVSRTRGKIRVILHELK